MWLMRIAVSPLGCSVSIFFFFFSLQTPAHIKYIMFVVGFFPPQSCKILMGEGARYF